MKTIVNYAQKVKEQHALNKTLAPVETDLTSASKAYAVGQKFIHDGVLYQAKTAIAQGAALVLNTNYEAADDVSSEIQTLTNEITEMNNLSGVKNWLNTNKDNIKLSTNVQVTDTPTGIRIQTTVDGSSRRVEYYLHNLKNNTDYIFSVNVTVTSGQARVIAKDITSGEYPINSYLSEGKTSISFNTSNYTDLYIALYCTVDRSEAGDVTYNDLMIRLASDSNDSYAQYAMTNRELTEVVQHIEGKYVVVGVNKNVYVTADGVKTAKELLNDLASAYITKVENLPDGEATSITGINVYIPTASAATALPSITTFSRGFNTNSNTSSINVIFRNVLVDAVNLMAVNVKVHSTLSSCEIKGYNLLNNNAAFDDGNGVIPSGTNFTLYYTEYTKVS